MGQKSTGILINNILPHLTGVAFTLFDIETFWLQAEVKIVKSNSCSGYDILRSHRLGSCINVTRSQQSNLAGSWFFKIERIRCVSGGKTLVLRSLYCLGMERPWPSSKRLNTQR